MYVNIDIYWLPIYIPTMSSHRCITITPCGVQCQSGQSCSPFIRIAMCLNHNSSIDTHPLIDMALLNLDIRAILVLVAITCTALFIKQQKTPKITRDGEPLRSAYVNNSGCETKAHRITENRQILSHWSVTAYYSSSRVNVSLRGSPAANVSPATKRFTSLSRPFHRAS